AGDQDQALRLVDQLAEDRRAAQVLKGQHLGGNGAEHRTGAAVLVEGVDAETRQRRDLEGEVDLEEFLVVAPLLVRHDVVDQRMHLLVVQRRDVDPAHVAVHPDHRRQAGGEVQVRCLVLDRKGQQFGDIHASFPLNAPASPRLAHWHAMSPAGSIALPPPPPIPPFPCPPATLPHASPRSSSASTRRPPRPVVRALACWPCPRCSRLTRWPHWPLPGRRPSARTTCRKRRPSGANWARRWTPGWNGT